MNSPRLELFLLPGSPIPRQHYTTSSDSREPTLKSGQQISVEDGAAHL
jgi:hypothetical protein